eukprot:scaffold16942_cov164-Skeletonema_marinoi.AAC.3
MSAELQTKGITFRVTLRHFKFYVGANITNTSTTCLTIYDLDRNPNQRVPSPFCRISRCATQAV